jgi:hypothetical protein
MELIDIKNTIEVKLKKQLLPSRIFLDRMRVIDENSRKGFAYNNPTFIPFYYWLGTILKTKNLMEVGFKLGLLSGTFLKSCKTVEKFFAFQEMKSDEFYSARLGRGNIKDIYKKCFNVYCGSGDDDAFGIILKSMEFDLVIINEEVSYDKYRKYFDLIWPQVSEGGIISIDYIKKHKPVAVALKDFCITKNIEPTYVNTNYGVGLIRKV